ncbi:hypothetical protein QRX50_28815 [Amycolatopsis carbonis]|uniref:Uncharacterized protein n=1 Tax=Amycolatopsis carbonis TaxID=715471 RepID=A0A9Y2IBU7_9PSEU|nr:hypothetical protein [Amycolatopsis sp. 2-15]WIX75508.1 hypothetical protein QRX50_28815 [Amycolatopsis sp. 2-15]
MIVEQVLRVLRNLVDEGLSVLLVEQNVRQSLAVSDYTYVVKSGEMVLGTSRRRSTTPSGCGSCADRGSCRDIVHSGRIEVVAGSSARFDAPAGTRPVSAFARR